MLRRLTKALMGVSRQRIDAFPRLQGGRSGAARRHSGKGYGRKSVKGAQTATYTATMPRRSCHSDDLTP